MKMFILMISTFFIANLIFEKYLIKRIQNKLNTFKVLLIGIGIEFIFLTLAAYINAFIPVLAIATVVISSFISVFYRNKMSKFNGGS